MIFRADEVTVARDEEAASSGLDAGPKPHYRSELARFRSSFSGTLSSTEGANLVR